MNRKELEKELKKSAYSLRYEKGYVCSVDVLIRLGYLSEKNHKDWRYGKIQYLEKVCEVNLATLSFINSIIKRFAGEMQLESSWTGYNQYGAKEKRRLIFSKSQKVNIEKTYSTHYVDKQRLKELKSKKASV